MSETEEDRAYYAAAEAAFIRRRGTPFLLSPRDFALLKEWRALGVPLEAVEAGIDEAFSRREERSAPSAGSTRSRTAATPCSRRGSGGRRRRAGRGSRARPRRPGRRRRILVGSRRRLARPPRRAPTSRSARGRRARARAARARRERRAEEIEASLAGSTAGSPRELAEALPPSRARGRSTPRSRPLLAGAGDRMDAVDAREDAPGADPRVVRERLELPRLSLLCRALRSPAGERAADRPGVERGRPRSRSSRRPARASSADRRRRRFRRAGAAGRARRDKCVSGEEEVLARDRPRRARAVARAVVGPARRLRGLRLGALRRRPRPRGEAGSLPRDHAADRRHRARSLRRRSRRARRGPGYRLRSRLHASGRGVGTPVGYFAPQLASCRRRRRLRGARARDAGAAARRSRRPCASRASRSRRSRSSRTPIRRAACSSRAAASGAPRDAAERLAGALEPSVRGRARSRAAGGVLLESGESRARIVRSEAARFASRSTPSSRRTAILVGALYASGRGRGGAACRRAMRSTRSAASASSPARCSTPGHRGRRPWRADARRGLRTPPAPARAGPTARAGRSPRSTVADFLDGDERRFTCVVADPPRAGLGRGAGAATSRSGRERRLRLRVVRPGHARARSAGDPGRGIRDPIAPASSTSSPSRTAWRPSSRSSARRDPARSSPAAGRRRRRPRALLVGRHPGGCVVDRRSGARPRSRSSAVRRAMALALLGGVGRRRPVAEPRVRGVLARAPASLRRRADRRARPRRARRTLRGSRRRRDRVDVVEGTLADFWSGTPPRARTTLAAERLRAGRLVAPFPGRGRRVRVGRRRRSSAWPDRGDRVRVTGRLEPEDLPASDREVPACRGRGYRCRSRARGWSSGAARTLLSSARLAQPRALRGAAGRAAGRARSNATCAVRSPRCFSDGPRSSTRAWSRAIAAAASTTCSWSRAARGAGGGTRRLVALAASPGRGQAARRRCSSRRSSLRARRRRATRRPCAPGLVVGDLPRDPAARAADRVRRRRSGSRRSCCSSPRPRDDLLRRHRADVRRRRRHRSLLAARSGQRLPTRPEWLWSGRRGRSRRRVRDGADPLLEVQRRRGRAPG